MESTTIYLVRHGETEANVTGVLQGQSDVALNENGKQQALLVGKRLKNKHFDVIFSSDLSRAAVTAQAIAGNREIFYTPLLREWDLGEWVGLTWSQVTEKFPEEVRLFESGSLEALVSGGESRREFYERAEKVIQWLISEHKGKEILCVSHGGLLRAIFAAAAGESGLKSVRTDNTCICSLKYFHHNGTWQLVSWNDTAHLEGRSLSTGW